MMPHTILQSIACSASHPLWFAARCTKISGVLAKPTWASGTSPGANADMSQLSMGFPMKLRQLRVAGAAELRIERGVLRVLMTVAG